MIACSRRRMKMKNGLGRLDLNLLLILRRALRGAQRDSRCAATADKPAHGQLFA